MARQESFEVQVCQQGRWLMQDNFPREADARALAKSLLSNGACEGVKILKLRQRDGVESESVIFSEIREAVVNDRIQVSAIEEAAWCSKVEECFLPPARATMARVLRQYFDKQVITPVEMLHNHRELKRVADFESLMPSAVGRVATIQAKDNPTGGDAKARTNAMFEWANKITEMARSVAETPNLPKLETESLDSCLAKVERALPPDRTIHTGMVILSQVTITTRNWLGKIEQLLGMLDNAKHPIAARIIDPIIADCLTSTDAIRDLLGRQSNLSNALISLVDLARGQMKVDATGDQAFIVSLNRHFGTTGLLPESREAVIESIRRQLRSRAPMSHGERSQQREAYRKVVLHVMGTQGAILGGAAMADAIILGNSRFVEEGGETGRKLALSSAPAIMEAPADRARLILAILQGTLAREQGETLIQQVMAIIRRSQKFPDLVKPEQTPPERLRSVALLQDSLMTTNLIPEPQRTSYIEKLDDLLTDFLNDTGFIAKLDDPSASVRLRAMRLVQFAASGVLTSGKAKTMLRDRLNAHVKQPDFSRKFVTDLADQNQHGPALADFNTLLSRANLG